MLRKQRFYQLKEILKTIENDEGSIIQPSRQTKVMVWPGLDFDVPSHLENNNITIIFMPLLLDNPKVRMDVGDVAMSVSSKGCRSCQTTNERRASQTCSRDHDP